MGYGLGASPWPLHPYAYLAPGDAVELKPKTASIDRFGVLRFLVSDDKTPVARPEGRALIDTTRWPALEGDSAISVALPPLTNGDAGLAVNGLQLQLDRLPRAQSPRDFRLVVRNTAEGALWIWDVIRDRSPLWYLVFDDTGRLVANGLLTTCQKVTTGWAQVTPGRDDDETLRSLPAGDRIVLPLRIDRPLPPGRYRVGIGLGRFASKLERKDIWTGSAFSNLVELKVR